ncbi:MAG: S-methyl-5-thioribose kinase [Acidimicrobiia bacterium]
MAPDYEILNPETVPAYIDRTPRLDGIVDTSTLEVSEVGDGNLNLVFVCKDGNGDGICLKQSLPYVRLVGEGWPLTPERVIAEARGLAAAVDHVPDLVPAYYGLDEANYVLAMENLIGWDMWRTQLNEGVSHPGVGAKLGRYVANLCFYTSFFTIDQGEIKERLAAAINPELCKITEDLVFTEPYIDVPNNSYVDELVPEVEGMRADARLRADVGMLKYKFMTAGQALIHGDLHTGSVMVRRGENGAECKVIDPEFCYYGPVGFDLGALFGNYLAARARAAVLDRPAEYQQWLADLGPETWDAFAAEMHRLWPERLDKTWTDGFLEAWLAQVARDTIGYGGCKANRRIIGLAKVTDIQQLPNEEHVKAATMVLRTASTWIRERDGLGTVAAANEVFETIRAKVLG